jgi:hypothetical protein
MDKITSSTASLLGSGQGEGTPLRSAALRPPSLPQPALQRPDSSRPGFSTAARPVSNTWFLLFDAGHAVGDPRALSTLRIRVAHPEPGRAMGVVFWLFSTPFEDSGRATQIR